MHAIQPLTRPRFRLEHKRSSHIFDLRNLIEKAESVLKRMRWKAHFFLKGEKSQENTRNFGLSSNKTPPTVLELKPFEEDVINY